MAEKKTTKKTTKETSNKPASETKKTTKAATNKTTNSSKSTSKAKTTKTKKDDSLTMSKEIKKVKTTKPKKDDVVIVNEEVKVENKPKKTRKAKRTEDTIDLTEDILVIKDIEDNKESSSEDKSEDKNDDVLVVKDTENKEPINKKKSKKNDEPETNKTKQRVKLVIASLMIVFFLVGLIVLGLCIDYAQDVIASGPSLKVSDLESPESSVIYDEDGNPVVELGTYLRENIEYEVIPNALIDAFLSIEDSRFFEHNGFDIPRFTRAMMETMSETLSSGKLSFGSGGSTLTMQLIKNTYFTIDAGDSSVIAEKSIDRKIQEIYMALQLETLISDEDIITLYLNKLNFGGNIRGVEKASQYYFGKTTNELTLSECALLAGIVNRPNAYNPYENLDYATERRNQVLDMMVYHGYITDFECSLAKSIKIEDQLVGSNAMIRSNYSEYQSYVDAVIEEVIKITGKDPAQVPMHIYTYLNTDIQDTMNKISNDEFIDFDHDLLQVSMVAIDNSTGHIVALGGGRNTDGARLFNRATSMYQQPGSSVKPFLSYALAFDRLGWATSHVVTDRPIVYRGTSKVIKNFNGKYQGDMTLWDAVGTSLNTPAIQTLQTVVDTIGRQEVIKYMNDIGFTQVNSDNFDLGYAIGGSSFIATPVQVTAAHATLINYGEYIEPHTVSKIVFADQSEYNANPKTNQALSPGAAYLASLLMENDVSGPYTNYMQILRSSYPVYAKTGTTDWASDGLPYGIPKGAAKDKWMVASTSDYTFTVWLGFDKAVEGGQTWFTSAMNRKNMPGKILRELLDSAYDEENPPVALTQPDDVSEITHILGTWPYVSVNGNTSLATTGLVLDEFNQTVSIGEAVSAIKMNNMSVHTDEFGTVIIGWHADGLGQTNEEGLKNISLSVGNTYIEAWGRQMFNYSWLLGNPTYVANIYVNGSFHSQVTSESGSAYVYTDPSSSIKACGYIIFSGGYTTNEVCN